MTFDKVIVFDVGKVLIDFSFDNFEKFLVINGAKISSRSEFFKLTNLYAFERGEIPASDFISSIQNLLSTPCTSEEIVFQWTNIFTPISEMILFCEEITKKTRTFIMSNTNALHWDFLDKNFGVRSLTSYAVTSYEEKSMKPDPVIYQSLEQRVKTKPENILFIDDLLNNTITGNLRGWKTIHHINKNSTKSQVLQFLEN